MARVGRVVCVALPVIFTIGAIISYMVATLSGVAHNKLYIFQVDLTDLRLDESDVGSLVNNIESEINVRDGVSAATLGLGESYDVTLWNYCENTQRGKRECKSSEFNWAENRIQDDFIDPLTNGKKVDLPSEIETALDVFATVTKYTEIAYIVTLVILALELIIGVFANYTRIVSCVTGLIGVLGIIFALVSSGLATAMAIVLVAAIRATADKYGVKASYNPNFLACIWIGAAFAIAAGVFFLLSACCCKPDKREKRRSDGEKLLPSTGYYPIGNDTEMTSGNTSYNNPYEPSYTPAYDNNNGANNGHSHNNSYGGYGNNGYSSHGYSSSDVAYEPYSHRA